MPHSQTLWRGILLFSPSKEPHPTPNACNSQRICYTPGAVLRDVTAADSTRSGSLYAQRFARIKKYIYLSQYHKFLIKEIYHTRAKVKTLSDNPCTKNYLVPKVKTSLVINKYLAQYSSPKNLPATQTSAS